MNEHEEPKLTSRRARRMQEQLETTGIPVVSSSPAPAEENAAENAAVTATGSDAIEISPVDENGRVRTRREMRELREAALARQAEVDAPVAAPQTDTVVDTEVDDEVEPSAPVVESTETAADPPPEAGADAAPADEPAIAADEFVVAPVEVPEFDDRLAPTEAMSFADLLEVSSSAAAEPSESAIDALDESGTDGSDEELEGEASVAAPAKGRFRMPWSRSKDAASDDEAAVEPEADAEAADDEAPQEEILEIDGDEDVVGELVAEDVMGAAVTFDHFEPAAPALAVDEDEDEDEDGEVADAPAPTSARTSYSFPDIAPLAEERSVFDDPATQAIPALPSDDLIAPLTERTGDFDDLISRAIAAEGATSSNTAALILPSMPEGTDLAGPLGETGELFVTGSIELPKSLGETGGHARLHDSIESDPLADLGIDLSDEPVPDDSAPVSATRAISARTVEGSGVVAPHTKKGNRLPLILSLTAGGLLLAVIGLLAWGASNGMFG